MPAVKKPADAGEFVSQSRRRDDRYTPSFSCFIKRNGNDKSVRIAANKSLATEAEAMKTMNAAFMSDDTISEGFIIEMKNVRTYHRHIYTDDNLCVRCGKKR